MAKRSLMLAGGGLKIAFQAGVLQVWLDEAGIEFDHGDGVSGATVLSEISSASSRRLRTTRTSRYWPESQLTTPPSNVARRANSDELSRSAK